MRTVRLGVLSACRQPQVLGAQILVYVGGAGVGLLFGWFAVDDTQISPCTRRGAHNSSLRTNQASKARGVPSSSSGDVCLFFVECSIFTTTDFDTQITWLRPVVYRGVRFHSRPAC